MGEGNSDKQEPFNTIKISGPIITRYMDTSTKRKPEIKSLIEFAQSRQEGIIGSSVKIEMEVLKRRRFCFLIELGGSRDTDSLKSTLPEGVDVVFFQKSGGGTGLEITPSSKETKVEYLRYLPEEGRYVWAEAPLPSEFQEDRVMIEECNAIRNDSEKYVYPFGPLRIEGNIPKNNFPYGSHCRGQIIRITKPDSSPQTVLLESVFGGVPDARSVTSYVTPVSVRAVT